MAPSNPRWLDIVRHRVRASRAPFFLVLQHHEIPAPNRITVPVTLPVIRNVSVLAPRLTINGIEYRARMLDMTAVPRGMLADTVASASDDANPIMSALDMILHGYPVGVPKGCVTRRPSLPP